MHVTTQKKKSIIAQEDARQWERRVFATQLECTSTENSNNCHQLIN